MITAPSRSSTRLNAARLAASMAGMVAPRIFSTAKKLPVGPGSASVPPGPCRLSAMHWTEPFSNGGGFRLTGGTTPGSAITRDSIRWRCRSLSSSVVSNIMKPPPSSGPPASAGRNTSSVSAGCPSWRRPSETVPGRYQNRLGSAWSR